MIRSKFYTVIQVQCAHAPIRMPSSETLYQSFPMIAIWFELSQSLRASVSSKWAPNSRAFVVENSLLLSIRVAANLVPLQGTSCGVVNPGLKPWAKFLRPFRANLSRFSAQPLRIIDEGSLIRVHLGPFAVENSLRLSFRLATLDFAVSTRRVRLVG